MIIIIALQVIFLSVINFFNSAGSWQEINNDFIKLKVIEETIYHQKITKFQFKILYKFIKKINSGSQGTVFKYFDYHSLKEVAVKIISTNRKETHNEFKKELDILTQLGEYDNIVKVHKYLLEVEDEHTFQIFLIMDLAEGTLQEKIEDYALKN